MDNFQLIYDTLFDGLYINDFFFVQVMQRKGKNSDINRIIKSFNIYSKESLIERKDEIIDLCKHYNAYAYIYVNPRSSKDLCLDTINLITEYIRKDNFNCKHIWDIACAKYRSIHYDNRWLLDIDNKDKKILDEYIKIVNKCDGKTNDKIIAIIPTIHGYHLITKGFNVQQFKDLSKDLGEIVNIQKDNYTLLYAVE